MYPMDYILNGQGHGDIATTLIENDFDFGIYRPWKEKPTDRRSFITQNVDGKLVNNYSPNPALFTKDQWLAMDSVVIEVARNELRAWGDLVGAGLTYDFDGFANTILQYQTVSESGTAAVSMDGQAQSERDRPLVDLRGTPLPIIHSDFWFGARELAIARKGRMPTDMVQLKNATRRIVETVEDMTIGNVTAYTYGGYSIPGYVTHSDRIAYTITSPTAGGWTPQTAYDEILDMREQARLVNFRGPFMLYFGTAWEKYLDTDYSAAYPGVTLRGKLKSIDRISVVRTLDNLSGYQILLVPMRDDVVRAITGMRLTTMQWPERGGMKVNWKVMCIMVPQIRSNYNTDNGIVHGNV